MNDVLCAEVVQHDRFPPGSVPPRSHYVRGPPAPDLGGIVVVLDELPACDLVEHDNFCSELATVSVCVDESEGELIVVSLNENPCEPRRPAADTDPVWRIKRR